MLKSAESSGATIPSRHASDESSGDRSGGSGPAPASTGGDGYCGGLCKVIDLHLGDPVSALWIDAGGIFAGTMMGRVVGVLFKAAPPVSNCMAVPPRPRKIVVENEVSRSLRLVSDQLRQGLEATQSSTSAQVDYGPPPADNEAPYPENYLLPTPVVNPGQPLHLRTAHTDCSFDVNISKPSKKKDKAQSSSEKSGVFGRRSPCGGPGSVNLCSPPRSRPLLYAAFCDDAVRMIHADSSDVHVVVGNSQARTFKRYAPRMQKGFHMDRRLTCNLQHVVPGGRTSVVLTVSDGVSVVIDVKTEKQLLCPLRLPDKDIVPTDFNGKEVVLYVHHAGDPRIVKVMRLPFCAGEPRWGEVPELLFELPLHAGMHVTHLFRFWGHDRLVFVQRSKLLTVYNYRTGKLLYELRGHSDAVSVMDTSDPEYLLSLSRNAQLCVWSQFGHLLASLDLTPATFRLGYPYFMRSYNARANERENEALILDDLRSRQALLGGGLTPDGQGEAGEASTDPRWPSKPAETDDAPPLIDKMVVFSADNGVYLFLLRTVMGYH